MKSHPGRRLLSAVLALLTAVSVSPVFATTISDGANANNSIQTASSAAASSILSSSGDRTVSFNNGWRFNLGDVSNAQNTAYDDSGWTLVSVPHDYSISQNFTTSGEAESGFLPGGTGWYRKSFTLPESYAGKEIVLNFDGVYSDAYVYINGVKLGEHHYGYTSFAFDLTDYLTCDGSTENVLAVKVVNSIPSSRWYSGSGIYRDVTLTVTDPVHIERYGTQVTTPDIASGIGTVSINTEVKNDSNMDASVTVRNTVYTKSGEVASNTTETSLTIAAGASESAAAKPVVASPALWSVDTPTLYTVRTEIVKDGNVIDCYDTTFGFRYFSFDSTGFHLNGKNVKLNGVCLHHDQGALGSAAYYDAMYRQISMMKDMGVNAIRISHNPGDEDFIDICNELGLLVIEEAFDGWVEAKNGNSNDFSRYFNQTLGSTRLLGADSSETWAQFAIQSMVRRDRNDPSVILWSLGNEVQEGTNWTSVGNYASIAQNLINWIKAEDTTRPTTSGDNNRGGDSRLVAVLNTIRNNGGVIGFNYANTASALNSLAQSYGGVIIASETSSATNSRGIYSSQANNSNADGKYHLTSYDTSSVGWGITAHDSIYNTYQYDCVAGEFVWTGFDYIGEPTPWNGTGSGSVSYAGAYPNSSYFGTVDTAGFEKDTYYLYRSQWNKASNTLHLVTAWDSDNMYTTGGKTPVVIYSNAPTVKLYRNGTLIGTATRKTNTSAAGHTYYTYTTTSNSSSVCTAVNASGSASLYATFNVTYASGTISAKAYNANGAEITASCAGNTSVSTPGSVSKLNVSKDKAEIVADRGSLSYITADVTDANGVLDTTATNLISFSLSGNGEIVGVDNGDQATTAKYQQPSVLTSSSSAKISAYAGKALVIVRSTKDAGSFTLTASASGLSGGSVTVITTEDPDAPKQDGLISYAFVRDYSVKAGTVPILSTEATGLMADGTEITGTIVWDEIPVEYVETAGDYTINGTLTFSGLEPIKVTARLHVIGNVVAMLNVSTVTTPGTVPTLPGMVKGVLADASLSGEFTVVWDTMTASQFAEAGAVVTVKGTASVLGTETLPVTASVRVSEPVSTESQNIASQADSLTEDCAVTSDVLESIRDGVADNSSDTNMRWTNYNNRNNSGTASITFTWATAHQLSGVNLYYFTDSFSASLPQNVKFEYSLNGTDFMEIGYQDVAPTAGFTKTEYVFNEVINPVAIRITLTQQSGRCVGLTECEIMTYSGKIEANTSALLDTFTADGAAPSGFVSGIFSAENYSASVSDIASAVISATSLDNAAVTILPVYTDNVVRVLVQSEDQQTINVYAVKLSVVKVEEIYASSITLSESALEMTEGDTKTLVATVLPENAVNKQVSWLSTNRNVVTVDKSGKLTAIAEGNATIIAATNNGYEAYCTVTVKGLVEKTAPTVSLHATIESGKIVLTAQSDIGANPDKYYTELSHGILIINTKYLGTKNLTVSTAGVSRKIFSGYKADGSYVYRLTPLTSSTTYAYRAYVQYQKPDGTKVYAYSGIVRGSYNTLLTIK